MHFRHPHRDYGASPPPPPPSPPFPADLVGIDPGRIVQVDVTGHGIGDAVMACGCVRTIQRDRPEHVVVLACAAGEAQWAHLFLPPRRVITQAIQGVTTYRPVETYGPELAEHWGAPRWERYGAACGTTWAPPVGRDLSAAACWWAEQWRGAVVLVPYASHKCRAWEPSHWRALVQDLDGAGYCPVVIDDGLAGDDRAVSYLCPRLSNEPAERVGALMRAAHVVISNDSGMAHVAAGQGVRTLVLCGQQLGRLVYGGYETAEVIQGPASCSGCHWRGDWGWHPVCDQLCASMNLIQPGDILQRIGPYSLLPGDRLDQLLGAVRETAAIGGAMAELGVFRGGSAREIARVDPSRPLHLFDTFQGLPDVARRGQYAARLDQVRGYLRGLDQVVFHPGLFGDDLPPDPIGYSLVHLDGDLYDSTFLALTYFVPRMLPGGVIVLDDWEREPGVKSAVADLGLLGQVVQIADGQARLFV